MPIRSLLPFCHEITHHLIFDTPVGAALAILERQARKMASRWNRSGGADHRTDLSIFENQLRYRSVSDFYKPLNEGLALFADFEGQCGMAERPSVRMQWTARLFVDSTDALFAPSAEEVAPILTKFRTCRADLSMIERKEQLLSQPLSCIQDGQVEGDLAGYLSVKNMFFATVQQSNVVDFDMFVTYMIRHFFEDVQLVELLLAPPSKTVAEAVDHSDRILTHIGFRIADVMPLYDPQRLVDGTPPRTGSDGERMPHDRELMCIGQIPADAEQCGDRIDVYSEGEQWGSFSALGKPRWRKSAATIEYFISPREKYEAHTVTISPDVIAVIVNPPDAGSFVSLRLAKILSRREEARKRAEEESAALINVEKQLSEAKVLTALYDDTHARIDRFYSDMALLRVSKKRRNPPRAETRDEMRNSGVLGLLDNDKDLLRRFATLSSFAAVLPTRKMIQELSQERKLDLDKTLADLRACSDRTGIELLLAIDDVIWTFA